MEPKRQSNEPDGSILWADQEPSKPWGGNITLLVPTFGYVQRLDCTETDVETLFTGIGMKLQGLRPPVQKGIKLTMHTREHRVSAVDV